MEEAAQAASTQFHFIDYSILIIYMIGVLVLGTYFGRYVKDAGDFFTAGRALPFWAIGMSIVVSDIGATDFMALAGAGYQYGITAANFDWIGSMPAMAIAAFFFIPYYWRSGVYTIPEFLGRRYNVLVQVLHGGIWGIFLLTMLAVMLWLWGLSPLCAPLPAYLTLPGCISSNPGGRLSKVWPWETAPMPLPRT